MPSVTSDGLEELMFQLLLANSRGSSYKEYCPTQHMRKPARLARTLMSKPVESLLCDDRYGHGTVSALTMMQIRQQPGFTDLGVTDYKQRLGEVLST